MDWSFTFSTPRSKRDPKRMLNGSENGLKMEPRSRKREPRAHFGAYESISKRTLKRSQEEVSDTARHGPGSRAWVPLIKGKHKPESLIKRVRDREGIIRRPLVPEGTVADRWCDKHGLLVGECANASLAPQEAVQPWHSAPKRMPPSGTSNESIEF